MKAKFIFAHVIAIIFATFSLFALAASSADINKISQALESDDARCSRGQCDYKQSENLIAAALKTATVTADRVQVTGYMAEVHRRKGEFTQAVELGNAALRLDPGNQRVHATLGESYSKLGQLGKARPHFAQAAAGPEAEHAMFNACRLAQTELSIGQIDWALRAMPQGRTTSARVASCLQNLAVEADTKKHPRLAAAAYHLAAKAKTSDLDSWIRAMYLYAHIGENQNAGKVIVEFSKFDLDVPKQYQTMYLYAVTQAAGPADALRIIRAWQRQEPDSLWIKERLATALLATNEAKEAEVTFKALVKEGSERKPAYIEGLLDAFNAQRKFAESASTCQAESTSVANSTRLKVKCGEVFQIRKQCAQALPLLNQAFLAKDLGPLIGLAALATGLCHEAASDWRAALAAYQQAPEDARIVPRIKIVQARISQR
ncbi:MAG: tetratricopeptide repeat protein [Betaproteobacteria bacterium]|nr:tetratricopeptide repeat protein [Betaproteobacteria bacterium]